ncbi:hypothetical protein BGZ82_003462 [Podila clonocystis]|nr:hypothetical protein BGZ82_003462 [Podila clonocystis]
MRIASLISLAAILGFVASSPISDKRDTSNDDTASQVPVFATTKNRAASIIAAGERDPYTWDFETFSQANYYGDRQRFNKDGCVNFHCVNFQSYKGLPNKEYIFYDGDDCYGAVILRTTQEKMSSIPQPFAPCSIRVQDPSNWKGAGKPPAGTDLAIYPQPRYKGKASTFVGLNKCHELKGDSVSSFQGHDSSTYTFYKDAGCKGSVLEKNKGPDSRTNTPMRPMSVMIV